MVVRINPASIIDNFVDILDTEFDEFFERFPAFWHTVPANQYPKLDVIENDDEVTIYAYLPGYKKDDIKLSISDDELVLSGKRDEIEIPENGEWIKNERISGSFTRTLNIPELVDTSKTSAKFENGVLEIHLPKKHEAKPKEIPIKIQ